MCAVFWPRQLRDVKANCFLSVVPPHLGCCMGDKLLCSHPLYMLRGGVDIWCM